MSAETENVIPLTRNAAVYSAQETTQLLNLPKGTVYFWLRNGTIPGIKSGGRWGVPKKRLAQWLDSLTESPEPSGRRHDPRE